MSVWGVVCEFNPFHKGHEALLSALRSRGAETIVCAMSGNFVQRGEPAIVSKLARAEMAVRGGADLVLELPTPWATDTAERFARGGVSVLAMALCDTIAFGSESGDTAALQKAAAITGAADFPRQVTARMADGTPYAAARQQAAEALGAAPGLLNRPNDILAAEYLKAAAAEEVDITPIAIPRLGAAHDGGPVDGIASASFIRRLLIEGNDKAFTFIPPYGAEILRREREKGTFPVDITNAERAVLDRLRRMTEADFAVFDSGGEGLYRRLHHAAGEAASLNELLESVKTRRYPTARLRRMLLRCWLDVESRPDAVPYLRVLAASEAGRCHLRKLRDSGAPVLTKAADVAALGPEAEALLRQEARCTDLYALCCPQVQRPGGEWRLTPYMAP
ncbi:MAG: nucleotidyltransferase family protein [Oscillospiraceae bacterium]|nr:nucleotidyltransferase family protein [Oscillospiraceae bacterium]